MSDIKYQYGSNYGTSERCQCCGNCGSKNVQHLFCINCQDYPEIMKVIVFDKKRKITDWEKKNTLDC